MLDGPPDQDAHGSSARTRPAVGPDALRHVLGHFATGVTIVTSLLGGDPRGVTVSALIPVSLDPPLVRVGRILAATGDDRHPPPLLYYRRRYHRVERARVPLEAMSDL
jgi:flavin reductase (DIM6/NTAB) family NADH-FMN oxidoreductase RutF